MKKKYLVEGMSCSACSSSVERVVKKIKGVKNASVNLTAKLLVVEGEFLDAEIFTAVKKAGFTPSLYNIKTEKKTLTFRQVDFEDDENKALEIGKIVYNHLKCVHMHSHSLLRILLIRFYH